MCQAPGDGEEYNSAFKTAGGQKLPVLQECDAGKQSPNPDFSAMKGDPEYYELHTSAGQSCNEGGLYSRSIVVSRYKVDSRSIVAETEKHRPLQAV